MNSSGLWLWCELSLTCCRQSVRKTQTEVGYMLDEKLTVPLNCVEFGGGCCLLWHDRTGVCVRVRVQTLLHINWGQWSQRAQHLKEETNCWKQASHLDFFHPCRGLWPLLLFLLLGSQIHSPLYFQMSKHLKQCRNRPTDTELGIPSLEEQTCKSKLYILTICFFSFWNYYFI